MTAPTASSGPLPSPALAMPEPPPRLRRPGPVPTLLLCVAGALVVHGTASGARISPATIVEGIGRTGEFLSDAFPPDLDRAGAVAWATLETFEIALIGTVLGVVLSIPLSVCAARNLAPGRLPHAAARGLIALLRTIPDVLWGLLFVVTVGLGPEAGVLAIAADVAGLCGRFFADRLEDVPAPLTEALRATGASPVGVLLGGVAPAVAPSFAGIALYGLENATRSSVILGVVGAGGIGIELTTSMELLRYDEATTIIIAIFVVVLAVERVAALIRRRLGVGVALPS
jgi:phosphonate transport system permease protein